MGLFDSPTHLLIILVVLVVLFGSAKLPKAAKSMGEAMRIFKKESAKLHEENGAPAEVQASTVQPGITAPQQPYTQQVPVAQPVYTQQPMAPQPVVQQPMAQPQPTVIQPEAQQTNQPS
jgi:sec-independent protein translocase protein TatA